MRTAITLHWGWPNAAFSRPPGPPSWSSRASTFSPLVFGLFRAGVVPVLIDPGMGSRGLGRCLQEAEPEIFIGVSKAIWARRVLGWGRRSVRKVIHVGPSSSWSGLTTLHDIRRLGQRAMEDGQSVDSTLRSTGADDTAAILFTSGSTGPPKGAVYTHSIFQAQIEIFRALYEIEPGEVDLCTFPLLPSSPRRWG